MGLLRGWLVWIACRRAHLHARHRRWQACQTTTHGRLWGDCGVTIVFADQYRFIDLANQLDGF
ncbi:MULTISPECIES: hypothetical protein [unclassified Serratia (in: enterobacteria)]|uniref:hypothetical protein n=1 Tax=unclassified Serratia (in: enterobacteria) TaxID=2647522 RepID=UPI000AE6546D|nr:MULTISPECIES: hypothetical protein [unclassified Serratia (in: enterobacteria)]